MKKAILLLSVIIVMGFLSQQLFANYSEKTHTYLGKADKVSFTFSPCNSLLDYNVTFHVTSSGNDLEGAWVTIGPVTLPTNASGIAVFNLPDGNYSYSVMKEGYVEAEGTFTVAAAPVQVEVEMEVEFLWQVTIHIIYMGGNPPDSALITLGDSSIWVYNNNAHFYVESGMYSVSVFAEGYYPFGGGSVIVNDANVTLNVTLYPILYGVSFFVNCCGEPLDGIMITIGTTTVVTGPNGLAAFNLMEGDYTVEIGGYIYTFSVPETSYVDADICSEVTFHSADEGGYDLDGVHIDINGENLITGVNGAAEICLQTGNYNYTAYKAGYVSQTGTIEVDTVPQTIEIIIPTATFGVTFQFMGFQCSNDFEGLIIIINGDTLLPGETIYLANGSYNYEFVLIECGNQYNGIITINNGPVTVNLFLPWIPQITFHITDQWGANFIGAKINVDNDVLITDQTGEVSFCMTGGSHTYWVADPGNDTIFDSFIFSCQDTTINLILFTTFIRTEKLIILDIFPNPSSGKFYLETSNSTSETVKLQVMDLTGRIVYERQPAIIERFEIDLSNQQKGMYFLRIKTEEENYTQKLIIQ